MVSSGLPISKVAAELGLDETVLRHWVARLGGRPLTVKRLYFRGDAGFADPEMVPR